MTSENFCYWLQGYFELNDKDSDFFLKKDQINCVKKHLDLTLTAGKQSNFLAWLSGIIDAIGVKNFSVETTLLIKKKLSEEFKNVTAPKIRLNSELRDELSSGDDILSGARKILNEKYCSKDDGSDPPGC